MKTEELMVGDWYQWYAEGQYYHYQVEPEDFAKDNIENFEPIPLTKDILELNGWKDYPLAYVKHFKTEWGVDTINLEKHNNVPYPVVYTVNRLVAVKSVHELQHLLRSCGNREIADNLKIK